MMNNTPKTDLAPVHVIGGGLAGTEAAWQLAERGISVILHEMRPVRPTEVHTTSNLAELVCSNSLRSDDAMFSAVGLLHEEMRRCGSLILTAADDNKVPAGGALAVDREGFSEAIEGRLNAHPNVTLVREEITGLPDADWDSVIIATGPLTSRPLAEAVQKLTGEDSLAFYDAIAPIVHKDSINFDIAWFQSRYDKGTGSDYVNCPMTEEQYNGFLDALLEADRIAFADWEADAPFFEGCLPIEVMAERGRKTLTFGPMKPVGLTNPHNPTVKPHAIVQLRQDNALGTLYNLVGFQTKLRHGEQAHVLRMIPGLETAEFARMGGIHRNTFVNGPRVLNEMLQLTADPRLRFAGQITGCEGYVESAAVGLMAGRYAAADRLGITTSAPPPTTAMGAILAHITGGAEAETYQPMNVNFGLFPMVEAPAPEPGKRQRKLKGKDRKAAYTARALADMDTWLASTGAI